MAIKLKICGVKTVAEAGQLRDSGVDFIGLNFVPSSKRCISLETAQSILAVLRGSPIKIIALFQDQPVNMVNDYALQLDADFVQLHGGESAEYARSIQAPVMRAVSVDPAASPDDLIGYIKDYPADYFVLDRAEQGRGDPVDIDLARQVVAAATDRVCLAGGINPDNLAAIVSKVRPYAIDISGGVRTDGAVDMAKVNRCLGILRSESLS